MIILKWERSYMYIHASIISQGIEEYTVRIRYCWKIEG